jgi:DMSO/TMAO reductase YedYZ molybdopterin-dependent catalytic subunit
MKDKELIISSDTSRENRIPPNQRETKKFPVLHYGRVYFVDITNWKLKIFGSVEKVIELDYKQFTSIPFSQLVADIHCVTGWSKLDTKWEGVSSLEIKKLVRILPEAKFVIIHTEGGFTTNLLINEFFDIDVILAVKYNNEDISPEHGYPLRLVVPKLYFWKSAKWVNGIEFSEIDKPGFWEQNGYHNHGDPWTEERYS